MAIKYFFLFFSMAVLMSVSFINLNAADKWQTPSERSISGLPSSPIQEPKGFLAVLGKVVYYVYIAFFIIAVLFIVLAAYDYLTKSGEPEKIKEVHKKLLYAAIAIVVALLAVGAEAIIREFLGGRGASAPSNRGFVPPAGCQGIECEQWYVEGGYGMTPEEQWTPR
jgi:hypothetical protein